MSTGKLWAWLLCISLGHTMDLFTLRASANSLAAVLPTTEPAKMLSLDTPLLSISQCESHELWSLYPVSPLPEVEPLYRRNSSSLETIEVLIHCLLGLKILSLTLLIVLCLHRRPTRTCDIK